MPLPPHAPQRAGAIPVPPHLANFPRGGGQPLPALVRQRLERAFGAGFADVRVHVGPHAAALGATAFTSGSNIYFAPGQFTPYALGRELAHVVQQRTGRVRNPFGSGLAVVHDGALGAEAARMGRQTAGIIQRITDEEATRGLERHWLEPYELWKQQMAVYGGDEDDFVTKVLEQVNSIDEMVHILKGDQKHRSAEARETLEMLAETATDWLASSSLTESYVSGLSGKIESLVALRREDFEQYYVTLVARHKPAAVYGNAKNVTNVEGYEIDGASYVRAENTQIHHVVHELVHAMADPSLKEVWGQLACEGTTELITIGVVSANSGQLHEGYPDERRDVKEFMSKANMSLQGLAQYYFGNFTEFPERVLETLGGDLGSAFLTSSEAYSFAKMREQTKRLVVNPVSFQRVPRTPVPKQKEHDSCFLTTACVEARGLPDDCHELTTLRAFRDSYVAASPGGGALIEEYYRIAPPIVAAMHAQRDAAARFAELYESLVARCVALIEEGAHAEAMAHYRRHVERLKVLYGVATLRS